MWKAMTNSDLLASWNFLLGEELVAFLLGAPPGGTPDANDPAADGVLRWLSTNVGVLESEDPRLPVALVRATAEGLPLAWALRRRAGGDVPDPDAFEEGTDLHVARIARDTFPVLLARPDLMLSAGPGRALPAADPTIGLSQVVDIHPSASALAAALDTEGLTGSDLSFRSAMMVSPLAELSPDVLLGAAARRMRHATERSAQTFMRSAAEVLGQTRQLVAGEDVELPAFIGFASLGLPQGAELTIPQGRLRRVNDGEVRYAPVSVLADSVLETAVSARVVEPGTANDLSHADGQERLSRLAREVCLATALGSPDAVPRTCPAVAWVTELAPLGGSSAFRPLHSARAPSARDAPMSENELRGLKRWTREIADADLSRVQIAVDRLLRALWEPEWSESLIDAVISWESLLGTRIETSFRVTAALAKLCEQDPTRRLDGRKRLQRIYDARSRLVHGEVPEGELHEHRAGAIATALDALRHLIHDHPELLALSKSSARADRLLLEIQ
jgi:Apea-like HEPN